MICKVKRTIEKYGLLENKISVAVGVSGGADSMCLLDILSSLKAEYGIIVKAVHLNHNLRGDEALRDERLVRDFCEKKGIELLAFSEDIRHMSRETGLGEEECGRIARYRCFKKAECDVTATAHTLSDSIETVVFNLIRGTGSRGLCGIPVIRDPDIIRPLIECTRQETEAYCNENSVPYVTDSSNLSDDYTRNFIRHNIIPNFSNVNSSFEQCIQRGTEILAEENSFIHESALKLLSESENEKGYSAAPFCTAHPAVSKRAVSILIKDKMDKAVESRHIDLVLSSIIKGDDKVSISKDLYLVIRKGNIIFEKAEKASHKWESSFENNAAYTPFGKIYLEKTDSAKSDVFDFDKVAAELSVGSRREGDSFTFVRRKVTKSLKKLFNEMKLTAEERSSKAVIHDGDKVLWVDGLGVNREYLPDEKTKTFYLIKKEGKNDD